MVIHTRIKERIQHLKEEYHSFIKGKESLLQMIDEVEIPESVYNSNAIENSTLTLPETEKILLELDVSRNVSLREVFEAKNLAFVSTYVRKHLIQNSQFFHKENILRLHNMLLSRIDDEIAGRFRKKGEYVKVGFHIAPAPEYVEEMMDDIIIRFMSDDTSHVLEKIARFHLDFETIHPFNDGNGRIGRVLINWQLFMADFPAIIIRDKEKDYYYEAFTFYRAHKNTKEMELIIALAVMESLHKRLAYLKGLQIIPLSDYARKEKVPAPIFLNKAKRQSIPAFREKGVWKIGV